MKNVITIPITEISNMSTLEIVIYATITALTTWYAVHVIRKAIKMKKIKQNKQDAPLEIKDEDEEE